MLQEEHRVVNVSTDESCLIPESLDEKYYLLEQESKYCNRVVKKCKGRGFVLNVEYYRTPTIFYNNRRLCLPLLIMRFRRPYARDSCAIPADGVYIGNCYCNIKDNNFKIKDKMQCLCELEINELNEQYYSKIKRIYMRQNCTINRKESVVPGIFLTCNIHNGSFQFENSYFKTFHNLNNNASFLTGITVTNNYKINK